MMIKMVDMRQDKGSFAVISQATSVDCAKEVKSWRTLRSLVGLVVPCCGGCLAFATSVDDTESVLGSTVTGTIYGYKKGHVSFCVQEDPRSPPLLLLELAVPIYVLVKEMQSGLLRIALKCEKKKGGETPLFSEPLWSMYCNGRKVGFALKRQTSDSDRIILNLMQSVSTGAGVIPTGEDMKSEEDELVYMRATYERVAGSCDSESFHMMNPDGAGAHELSIFLLRS